MEVSTFFFYLISFLILAFGILTVTSKKIFRSAIYLLFTLINVAALYFYFEYNFIAAVQIVVYVGGIVVLILFSLFLTHQVGSDLPSSPLSRKIFAVLACLFGLGFSFFLTKEHIFQKPAEAIDVSMKYFGKQMLNYGDGGFVLPFEAVSVLLLAAMIGCIAIALKTKQPNNRTTEQQTIK